MKIGIYTPYHETLGGGERYIMSLAESLAQKNQVEVFWQDKAFKRELANRFSLSLDKVKFVDNAFLPGNNLWQKRQATKNYDAFFFVSDGSLPFLFAKKNFIHFQVPFTNLKSTKWLNKLKLQKIDQVFCNSRFTKKYIDQELGIRSEVIYPPVDVGGLKPGKKEKIILSVGRLGESLNNKKQEILLEVFKNNCNSSLKGWQLVIVGGVRKGDEKYLKELKKQAKGLPVKFKINASFEELKKIYGRAGIFWHAAGFGETRPERMEHFGMVVVEAMAAGCVPVVINKGGIPEIVQDQINGLLWDSKKDLSKKTFQLIKSKTLREKLSLQAIKDSQKFSKEVFCQKINQLIND